MLKFEKKKIHKGRGKKGGEKAKTILINAGKFPPEKDGGGWRNIDAYHHLLQPIKIQTNNN